MKDQYFRRAKLILKSKLKSRITTYEETVDPKEFKKTKEERRKNEWTTKKIHGQFVRDMEDKDKNNTYRLYLI